MITVDPFIDLNEIVESPGSSGVREFRPTGKSLRMVVTGDGITCTFTRAGVTGPFVDLDKDQARSLRDWLDALPL